MARRRYTGAEASAGSDGRPPDARKKRYLAVETEMYARLAPAEKLRQELKDAIQNDADAFKAVMETFKLPAIPTRKPKFARKRSTPPRSSAARCPLETAK